MGRAAAYEAIKNLIQPTGAHITSAIIEAGKT